jgi:uncharacterized membrane protein YphA (DoxX/SURF4 family)
LLPPALVAVPVWLPVAVWFSVVVPVALVAVALVAVALVAVALVAVALVPVTFCCAITVSLPMTDNNHDINAAATNIPAMGIAAIALAVLLLLLLSSGPLRRFIDAKEGT